MSYIPKKINIKKFKSISPELLDKSYEDDKWTTIWFQNEYKLFLVDKNNNDCIILSDLHLSIEKIFENNNYLCFFYTYYSFKNVFILNKYTMEIELISNYLITKDNYFEELKPLGSYHIEGDIIDIIDFSNNIITMKVLYDSTCYGAVKIWNIDFDIENKKIVSYKSISNT